MNYEKNYYDYINYVKKLNRKKVKGIYYEKHHIIPRSCGGDNSKDNLILLTAREHYLAHYLLTKFNKSEKMLQAFWFMTNDNKHNKLISSKIYERMKINLSEIWSIERSGENHWNFANEKEKTPFYGKKHSLETLEKMKHSQKNRVHKEAKEVICVETGECFRTINEASEKYNICNSSIVRVCKGKQETAGKLHWEYKNDKIIERKNNSVKKKVICIQTGEIFNSETEASKKYKIKPSGISACCRGVYKSSGGFKWVYC